VVVSSRHSETVAVVRLEGRLTLSPALHKLKPRVDKILSLNTTTGLILDLSGVPDIDSAGLGELLTIHTSTTRRGLPVALANVNPRVQEVLTITRLDGIFTVCADEKSALESIAKS
jgi:anti-sigma B factor antagonist